MGSDYGKIAGLTKHSIDMSTSKNNHTTNVLFSIINNINYFKRIAQRKYWLSTCESKKGRQMNTPDFNHYRNTELYIFDVMLSILQNVLIHIRFKCRRYAASDQFMPFPKSP